MSEQIESIIRVVMIDDHSMVRAALRILIESHQHINVIAEATNRDDGLARVIEIQPDVILLDLDLGKDDGLDLLPELRAVAPDARILVLTGLRDAAVHRRAIRLGALGVVLKETSVETLVTAIDKVYAGEVWLERSMVGQVLKELTDPHEAPEDTDALLKIATLTPREREIIWLIGEGLKNSAIAERLSLSEATVRNHLTSIFNKLGVVDRFELVIFAYRHRLARLPT